MLGPIPIYFVDLLGATVVILGFRHMSEMYKRHLLVSRVVLLLMLSLVPTIIGEYLRIGLLEPSYLAIRAYLHILAVWSLSGLLRNPAHLTRFLIGVGAGVLITSMVATLNSLPITGPWMRAHIFTIDWLKPTRDVWSSERIMLLDKGEAERGNSLIGQSNITGCVIISMLPFLVGITRNMKLSFVSKTFLQVVVIAGLFAALFTYSRSIYLGLAVMLLGYLIFDKAAFSKRFLPLVIVAVITITAVGFQSTLFKFDFLAEKFDLSSERYARNNESRILAYTRPVELLFSDPTYFFMGAGRTFKKVENADADVLNLKEDEMHSVFAASIFWRGFISMVTLFYLYYLLAKLSYRSYKQCKQSGSNQAWLATAALISLMTLAPPWAFTHYFVSKQSGHMFLFFLIAVIVACLDYARYSIETTHTEKTPPAEKKPRILRRKKLAVTPRV